MSPSGLTPTFFEVKTVSNTKLDQTIHDLAEGMQKLLTDFSQKVGMTSDEYEPWIARIAVNNFALETTEDNAAEQVTRMVKYTNWLIDLMNLCGQMVERLQDNEGVLKGFDTLLRHVADNLFAEYIDFSNIPVEQLKDSWSSLATPDRRPSDEDRGFGEPL